MKKNIFISLFIICIFFSHAVLPQSEKKDDTFQKATTYFFQKKFEMAELMLQEVIKKDPENEAAYSYLGDIYLKKNQFDGALNLYNRALEINPDSAENYFRIGQIYYYKKIANLALENFNKALSLDPKLKIVYYHRGLTTLMLLRDKESTITNWGTFIELAPEDPQYESIKRVIELLKDPNFKIPPEDSDISIEEALLLGGVTLENKERQGENKKAEHEEKKSSDKMEDIYIEDDL